MPQPKHQRKPWSSTTTTMVVLANAILILSPIVIGTLQWLLSLSRFMRFVAGILLGFLLSALLHLHNLHRSQHRRSKALRIAQLTQTYGWTTTSAPKSLSNKSDFEKVNWLNKELEEIWPSLNKAFSGLLKQILQSVLEPYKFSIIQSISIKSVTLGTHSPLLGGVKFSSGGKDETVLEVELDWRHGQDAKIIIDLQTTGPVLSVQIKDFVVFGVLKLIFKPLRDQFPGFGAVTIALKEPPIVDFQTKFLGGDILAIPGVDNAVDNIILTALTDMLVWPNRLVIPILEGDYSYLQLKSIGQLKVDLVEAKDVAKADIFGESDPYVIIYIRRKQGCIRTSTTKMNTNCPVWNETFYLDVEDLEAQKLIVQVFDHDRFKIDDFIGASEVRLHQLKPGLVEDLWIDLMQDIRIPDGKCKGKVHLRICFIPVSAEKESASSTTEDSQGNDGKMGN